MIQNGRETCRFLRVLGRKFVRGGDFVRSFMHALSSTALRRSPLPEGALIVRRQKLPRTRRTVEDACPYKRKKMRAGRRARDEIWVLPAALRGEKSVIGGICNSSEAPHLHRKSLREVRSEFLWTVARASGDRTAGSPTSFLALFSFWERKKCIVPLQREIVRGREVVGNLGAVSPLRLALRATCLAAARSRSGSESRLGFHSTPSRRYATHWRV